MKIKVVQEKTGASVNVNIDIPEDIITITDYSDRSILVAGGSALIKSELKKLGGKFGRNFDGEAGWIFSKANEKKIRRIVDAANQFIGVKEIVVTSESDSEYIEPLKITQLTAGTFNLEGDTVLLEDELRSLGCELLETNGNMSVWHFTRNKFNAVEALVSVVNKLR